MTSKELKLINQAQVLIEENDENIRQCDVCNQYMVAGYLHEGQYFDTEGCLNTVISKADWNKIDFDNSDESYWTEWSELNG